MTALGSRVSMTHLCTTQRRAAGTDSWGQASGTWTDHLTNQVCRAWFVSESLSIMPGEIAGVTTRHLALPLGTDILETDRVTDVTYRGAVIFEGAHTIDQLITWPDRIELVLRRAD